MFKHLSSPEHIVEMTSLMTKYKQIRRQTNQEDGEYEPEYFFPPLLNPHIALLAPPIALPKTVIQAIKA